jgi:hypothetical protein
MMTMETVRRIRRAYFVEQKAIRQIVRELRVSRKTVRKSIHEAGTEFRYERRIRPQPQLGRFVAQLDEILEANAKRPPRERLTAQQLYELLRADGYLGAYDSAQRHVRQWRRARMKLPGNVFIPLWFAPGEACQFDWSHEIVVLGGVTTAVKAVHVRLCHSRMFLLRAYPRETQEMVFDVHDHVDRATSAQPCPRRCGKPHPLGAVSSTFADGAAKRIASGGTMTLSAIPSSAV